MQEVPIYFIDAFASQPFRGNPAAVCILEPDHGHSDQWMQNVAIEVKHSETAFVVPQTGSLRWFTPGGEVDLCGHATVATAVALEAAGLASSGDTLQFQTRSGQLSAELLPCGAIELNFPSTPPVSIENIEAIAGSFPNAVGVHQSRFDLLVELPSEQEVIDYEPDFETIGKLEFRGVMITAASERPEVDFVSRFFAPRFGVDEDPVTGSAHCCLTPFWSEKLGKTEMKAEQLSKRGGEVDIVLLGDLVKLRGSAVVIIEGKLFVHANP